MAREAIASNVILVKLNGTGKMAPVRRTFCSTRRKDHMQPELNGNLWRGNSGVASIDAGSSPRRKRWRSGVEVVPVTIGSRAWIGRSAAECGNPRPVFCPAGGMNGETLGVGGRGLGG
ncbi:hypothetical protein FB451DRAFT_1170282 [Mycena latifolia]|nr:hypothetical protein FB451DRAFT_1170282 [Mycena latifolia]